ncbi:hypothetical protein [Mesorhizobium sp. M0048]
MDPIPGTLVVNIGAVLELASNGYFARDRASGRDAAAGVQGLPFRFS